MNNESVICFDVDETLIMHKAGKLKVKDPYVEKTYHKVKPHNKHIQLLKTHKGRGYCIVVWSAGGVKWAENVVKALDLESYVDLIITKPLKYVDDLEADKILTSRVYLNDN